MERVPNERAENINKKVTLNTGMEYHNWISVVYLISEVFLMSIYCKESKNAASFKRNSLVFF